MFRNKKINGILFLLVIMVIVIVTMHVFQMDRSEISTYIDQRIVEEGKLFLQGLTELKNEHLKVTANLKEKIELLERENNDRKTELESMHTLTKEMAIKQDELFAAHQPDILFEK